MVVVVQPAEQIGTDLVFRYMLRISKDTAGHLPDDCIEYAHQRCQPEERCHFIPDRQESAVDFLVLKQRRHRSEYAIPEQEK
jgi:hypothetical protein